MGPGPVGPVAVDVAALCAASNGALNAGLTPARRLTRAQYNNTVRDLLDATGDPAAGLATDERIGPFESNAIAQVDETAVEKHNEVATILATGAAARMAAIAGCDLAAGTGTTCATQFVTNFGRKAFRRPLTTAETQKYVALYTLGRQDSAQIGFSLVVEAMLQSPYFLYHHDVGATGVPQPNTVPVAPYELASRLSYFLWNSMPDEPLFTAAGNGTLTQESVLMAQAQRLITSPKAKSTIGLFHRQWLDVEGILDADLVNKNATAFPTYDAAMGDAMLKEVEDFSDHVIRSGDGLLRTLFTSNVAFPTGKLFGVYGVAQPAGYVAGTPVALDATKRAGILTQAAFLTRWAHSDQTSPVHRGKLVRTNIMCGKVDPVPAGLVVELKPPTPNTSTRERFAEHSAGACGECHKLMDPIGLGFEHYDPIGAYRTTDGPGAVDARGEIVTAQADLVGPFNGAVELADKLSRSQQVETCVVNQWFRFSTGRMESENDSCSIQGIRDAFRASGGNLRQMLTQIILSPAFRNVRANGG